MTNEMAVAESVALLIHRELEDDYVGMWKVPWHVRRALPSASDDQVHRIAAAILESLTSVGVALGSLDEETGSFLPWPSSGATETAMTAWRRLGRDPNIGEVAWLAM